MTGKICFVYLKFQSLIKDVSFLDHFVLGTSNGLWPGIQFGKVHVISIRMTHGASLVLLPFALGDPCPVHFQFMFLQVAESVIAGLVFMEVECCHCKFKCFLPMIQTIKSNARSFYQLNKASRCDLKKER